MNEQNDYNSTKEDLYKKNYQYFAKKYNGRMIDNYGHPIDLRNIPETEFGFLYKEFVESDMEFLHFSKQKYTKLLENYTHTLPLIVFGCLGYPQWISLFTFGYIYVQKKWAISFQENINLWRLIKKQRLGEAINQDEEKIQKKLIEETSSKDLQNILKDMNEESQEEKISEDDD